MSARLAFALLLVLGAGSFALAGPLRPNALDRAVDAIPAARLLASPPGSLLDADRQAAAARLQTYRTVVWSAALALQIGLLGWCWRSGWAARVRDRLRRRVSGEFAVRLLFGAWLAALVKGAALVPQFVDYRISRVMSLTTLPARDWALEWLAGTLLAMLAAGVVAALVLWLADRTHHWYLYTIAGVIAVNVAAAALALATMLPPVNRYEPLPARWAAPLRAQMARAGVRVALEEARFSGHTKRAGAYVVGLGRTERVVLSDTLIAGSTPREIAFAVARETGHVLRGDPARLLALRTLLVLFGAALAVFVADRIGFRRDDDPVSRLALVGAFLGIAYVVALVPYNAYERTLDLRALRYAAAFTHDPAAGIRLTVRSADQDLQVLCPSAFAMLFTSSRPAAGTRIALLQGSPDPCR